MESDFWYLYMNQMMIFLCVDIIFIILFFSTMYYHYDRFRNAYDLFILYKLYKKVKNNNK